VNVKKSSWKIALALLLCGVCSSAQPHETRSHPNVDGWDDLFDSSLSNAIMNPGGWILEDGVLRALGHGVIWTDVSYGNFVLDLEFKVAKSANSGVFFRVEDMRRPVTGIEVQIHETSDKRPYGMVGAIYDAKPPSKAMAKPAGEWNRYTITCIDSKIYLVFNGEQVIDIDLNDWTVAHQNPDGTPNKFSKRLKDYPRSGPIGLQGLHGKERHPVWFRNLKIKVLD
jgi:hypothetical protein